MSGALNSGFYKQASAEKSFSYRSNCTIYQYAKYNKNKYMENTNMSC